jgi:hypothetical protein
MSPKRPSVVTSTLVTTRNPRIIHNRKKLFPVFNGSIPIPRKMSGRAMSVMEPSIVAINMPSVEMKSAVHL